MLSVILQLVLISHFSSHAQNMGYRFENGYCQKNRASGYNPNFRGECGMYTRARVSNEVWQDLKLTGINLNGSIISRSHFKKIDLNHAAYRMGAISESTFENVEAQFVDFRGALLKGVIWKDSNLQSIIASGSRMEKSKFINCDLQKANLWGANLQESDLSGSDLRGANLQSTYTLFTNFKGAKFDGTTLLPFSREEAINKGMVEVD